MPFPRIWRAGLPCSTTWPGFLLLSRSRAGSKRARSLGECGRRDRLPVDFAVDFPIQGLEPAPQPGPGCREARVKFLLTHALKADPLQFKALRVADGRFEGLDDLGGDRRIGPVADVEDRGEQHPDGCGRDGCFLVGLPERAADGVFTLMQGTAGKSPRPAVVAPRGPVLKQDALFGVVH